MFNCPPQKCFCKIDWSLMPPSLRGNALTLGWWRGCLQSISAQAHLAFFFRSPKTKPGLLNWGLSSDISFFVYYLTHLLGFLLSNPIIIDENSKFLKANVVTIEKNEIQVFFGETFFKDKQLLFQSGSMWSASSVPLHFTENILRYKTFHKHFQKICVSLPLKYPFSSHFSS